MPFLSPLDNDLQMRRFIAFNGILPDEVVAECVEPFIPVEIERKDAYGWVTYYTDQYITPGLRERLDSRVQEFEDLRHAEWQKRHDAVMEKIRIEIALDDTYEVPGRSNDEDTILTMKPGPKGQDSIISSRPNIR